MKFWIWLGCMIKNMKGKLRLNKDGVLVQGHYMAPLPAKKEVKQESMSPEAMLAAMREIIRQEIQAVQVAGPSGKMQVHGVKQEEMISIDSSIVVTELNIDHLEKNFESIGTSETTDDKAVSSTTSKLAALKNKKS